MIAPVRQGPLSGVGTIFGWQITSYFGGRVDPLTGRPGNHGGMDLAFYGCTGQPIIAPIAGLLSQGWDSSGGGNWSSLTGHNGDYWGFGHAERFAFTGGGSRWVEAGTVIAYVGTTGGSTGPHLHIAYRPKGASGYRDPYDALRAVAEYVGDVAEQTQEEDEMTPEQMQELKDYLDERLEQVASADRLHMAAIRDQGVASVASVIAAAAASDDTTDTRLRDELAALVRALDDAAAARGA